ncbi:MAG: prepilin-type N-terminal cleavage/methylation domain-containing protein [Elusimicrobiaceae bacterium]|nr:prepilin-type N-terminal cleavage/methylation domain-containing protein [Elusimicrobiaceae bacterium]
MKSRGFTLIELLAVVLILGVLTAIAMPQYRRSVERSRLAEAYQMLPSIFDARERLITERGLSWPSRGVPLWTEQITFPKLDIEMKGWAGSNVHMWETDNFTYYLFRQVLLSPNGRVGQPVSAQFKRGGNLFRNTVIYYDGDKFFCQNPSTEGEETACSALGFKGNGDILGGGN